MKRLVIIDLWGSVEHQAFNQKYIDYIEKFRDVVVFSPKGLLKVKNLRSEVITIEGNIGYRGKILNRIQYIKNIIKISSKIVDDEIFILCYDIISFFIFFLLNHQKKIVLLHHQHLKQLENKVHKFIFSLYKDKVSHVVLENSFKKNLIKKIKIKEDKVFVCHHPLFEERNSTHNENLNIKNVLSISNSYDKNLMNEFINNLKNKNFKEKIFFRIRCKEEQFNSNDILIENKKYTYDEIKEMYEVANISIILANAVNFKDRISGTIFDAFSRRCFIFSTRFDFSLELERRYPFLIETFENVEELINKIENKNLILFKKEYEEDLNRFYKDYSENKIEEQLRKIFEIKY